MTKTWKTRAKAFGFGLLTGVVCVLMLLSFLLTVLSFSMKAAIGTQEDYRRIIQDEEITQGLLDYARIDLEAECLFYGLPFDIIDASLSASDARDFSLAYMDAVYDTVFGSGKLQAPSVEADQFRDVIAAHLAEEQVEDTVIDDLAAEFAAVTTAVWRMGLSQKILSPLRKVMTHNAVKLFLNSGALLAGITAVLLVAGLALGWRRIRRQTFRLLGTLTVGSMMLFVPCWLLHRYDIATKLVLGESPLRLFVVKWLTAVTAELSTITLWVMIGCAVATTLAAAWVVWPKRETATEVLAEETTAEETE